MEKPQDSKAHNLKKNFKKERQQMATKLGIQIKHPRELTVKHLTAK